ncbi:MAG: 30S ribosomal protein S2 [Candidatus Woesebacteria bacterium GW2011_GWB1_43_14]|uniref:Small ribosomal subunit protein uS2 n=1 Tax=Candidatus Woesebacteria bacterium GW2011_GWB1_43_14 TaxID=1618578 RepID=A0A0G1DGX4_9BACT|nr:MAG: 30S ribosomal protein S2 [Candidatus Woesebacteria bacterium GW2011_GWA1_39_11b]KKS77743.1 MAG: 30S ribosomal protein S2 [Candidatus Woesebacteria bacterium GW2011_GWC1_42_9]KKS96949.1 MAG: 30S ribosomal protein S2 [Candidatus Woesebacteria bacterium GW2011_GWB1_43_14]
MAIVKVDIEKLLELGAHFGHQNRRWNPKMEDYIYGLKDGVRVFDLVKTVSALEKALAVVTEASKGGKVILFVGTKKQIKDKIKEVGLATGCPYVDLRWLGGTLTNFEQIRRSIRRMGEMKEAQKEGKYKDRTKKERLLIDREIEKMDKRFGGISGLESLPDLMIIFDIHRENSALREANFKKVDTVGIVDSNSDPSLVTWPVPMNDDAAGALEYVLDLFKEAVMAGRKSPARKAASGKLKKK